MLFRRSLFFPKEGFFIKILLTALNAKYIHSSLALRSLKTYCKDFEENIKIAEFTINNDIDFIVNSIYNLKPDVIGFSCYIWNFTMILEIIKTLRKVLPDIKIILGGPEVSYEVQDSFDKAEVDIVIIGEGEASFKELADYFINKNGSLSEIKGIAYKEKGKVIITKERDLISLDEIDFVYKDCISEFENKIIYYESSRGCPYSCQYCLSSASSGVRFLSAERVLSDLNFFLENKVKQVKFVDRTFNCNKKFAIMIWEYLIENDNLVTNFHFEISADILDKDMLNLISKARTGLFQFEIGIQSTNLDTLEKIKRKTNLEPLFENVVKISKMKNIHQHLDLIVGLPNEDYDSFRKSFNDVFSLFPEQLQIGFLKLLKGSGLRRDADKFGIVYRDNAPYEVLFTKNISYEQIQRLKLIEELVETYYNSGKAYYTIRFLLEFFSSPFDFFEMFSKFWEDNGHHLVNHDKMKLYLILFEFSNEFVQEADKLKDIIKFDILNNDNIRSLPQWLNIYEDESFKNSKRQFFCDEEGVLKMDSELSKYSSKQLSRMCSYERFSWNIADWIESDFEEVENKETDIFFYYKNFGGMKRFSKVL